MYIPGINRGLDVGWNQKQAKVIKTIKQTGSKTQKNTMEKTASMTDQKWRQDSH